MNCFTCYGAKAILYPLLHSSAGLVSRNQTAQAASLRFFYARKLVSSSLLCRAGQALARVAGYVWPVDQPAQSGSMIGLMWSGLKLYTNEVTIMTTPAINSAKSSQLAPITPLFSLFAYRRPIAQNITGTLAERFKRRYPTFIVKFSGFEGGAA